MLIIGKHRSIRRNRLVCVCKRPCGSIWYRNVGADVQTFDMSGTFACKLLRDTSSRGRMRRRHGATPRLPLSALTIRACESEPCQTWTGAACWSSVGRSEEVRGACRRAPSGWRGARGRACGARMVAELPSASQPAPRLSASVPVSVLAGHSSPLGLHLLRCASC